MTFILGFIVVVLYWLGVVTLAMGALAILLSWQFWAVIFGLMIVSNVYNKIRARRPARH
jgi:membrane protein implicated in regulation of membrane protease activity